jgi:hypothetical protein
MKDIEIQNNSSFHSKYIKMIKREKLENITVFKDKIYIVLGQEQKGNWKKSESNDMLHSESRNR